MNSLSCIFFIIFKEAVDFILTNKHDISIDLKNAIVRIYSNQENDRIFAFKQFRLLVGYIK